MEADLRQSFLRSDDWSRWSTVLGGSLTRLAREPGSFAAVPFPEEAYSTVKSCLLTPSSRPGDDVANRWQQWANLTPPAGIPAVRTSARAPRRGLRHHSVLLAIGVSLVLGAEVVGGSTSAPPPLAESQIPLHQQQPPLAPAPLSPAPETPAATLWSQHARPRRDPGETIRVARRGPVSQSPRASPNRRAASTSDRSSRQSLDATDVPRVYSYVSRVHVVLRGGPGKAHPKRGVIPPGERVTARARKYGSYWVQVTWRDQTGWIAPIRGYLRPDGDFTYRDIPTQR